MKKPKPNKRVTPPRATSFKRIASVLRVRARGHKRYAEIQRKAGFIELAARRVTISNVLSEIASELDNEARTLRAQW